MCSKGSVDRVKKLVLLDALQGSGMWWKTHRKRSPGKSWKTTGDVLYESCIQSQLERHWSLWTTGPGSLPGSVVAGSRNSRPADCRCDSLTTMLPSHTGALSQPSPQYQVTGVMLIPDFPASTHCAPDSLAIDTKMLHKFILHYITSLAVKQVLMLFQYW